MCGPIDAGGPGRCDGELNECRLDGSAPQTFKESIDVTTDGFEGEARTYADMHSKYEALRGLIAVKDQMIWCVSLRSLSSLSVPNSPSTTMPNPCHPAACRSLVEERSQLKAALAAGTMPPASDAAATAQ